MNGLYIVKAYSYIEKQDKEDKQTYTFENEHDLDMFMQGVNEANGWLDYELVEEK